MKKIRVLRSSREFSRTIVTIVLQRFIFFTANRCKIHGINILILILLANFTLIPAVVGQSIFSEDSFGNDLYKDITARKVGDTVTVIIFQTAQADQSTETKRDRQASLDASYGFTGDIGTGTAGAKLSGQTGRSGSRSISREVSFIATVTAQVIEVLANGQLKIEGHQNTSINDQRTEIKVSGIINKTDIAADNTVSSSLLADANIEYREPKRQEHKAVTIIAFPFRLIGRVLKWIF